MIMSYFDVQEFLINNSIESVKLEIPHIVKYILNHDEINILGIAIPHIKKYIIDSENLIKILKTITTKNNLKNKSFKIVISNNIFEIERTLLNEKQLSLYLY